MGLNNFTNPNSNNNGNGNGGGNGNGNPYGGGPIMLTPSGQTNNGTSVDPLDMLINYNEKYAKDGYAQFRDAVISQTLSVCIGKNKPNALLVGQAGVGKTKIVEDIACKLANDDPLIPDTLKGYTIYELPLSNIVSGASFVGMVEENIQAVLEFATDKANKVILFIDEIHQLMNSHGSSYEKIAQIMKPALARGDIRVIAATTTQEAKMLLDDPAFSRRFSRIIVDELSREQTIEILKQVKASYFQHYNQKVVVSDDMMEMLAIIADQNKTEYAHRPDNALTLLDRSMADAVMARKKAEEEAKNDPNLLAAIQATPFVTLSEKRIRATANRLLTGNNEKDELDFTALATHFTEIKGQDDVIEVVTDILERDALGVFPRERPLSFLFAGTSGVGKTEIAKIIAEEMTGMKPIILNMTEYHSSASINRIIGAPAGYVGSDSNVELPFDILETNPYQVILLDEFEKCDKAVQTLFMNALDEGFIKTNRNTIVDFSKSIIIATTNAAHKTIAKSIGFTGKTEYIKPTEEETVSDLSKWFDTALLGRFTKITTFRSLDEELYREIIRSKYEKELNRIRKEHPKAVLPDVIPDDDMDTLVKDTYSEELGARPANRAVKTYIEDTLIKAKRNKQPFAGQAVPVPAEEE